MAPDTSHSTTITAESVCIPREMELLRRFANGEMRDEDQVIIVAAHPDDEVIGCGSRLRFVKDLHIIHMTDGSPFDLRDAHENGLESREEYACVRARELREALQAGGAGHARIRRLNVPDQQASIHLVEVARTLRDLFATNEPALVLTHPYEGGHPDHDACAFAVHAAAQMCGGLTIAEFTSYHAGHGGMVTHEFLPLDEREQIAVYLDAQESAMKQQMLDSFTTQQKTLQQFSTEVEQFRLAPRYDFSKPPHAGRLFYENFDWGMTGDRFRMLAGEALHELGVETLA